MKRLAAAALLLGLARTAAGAPPLSASAVLDQMENALNAGNVEAFVAWFAPDGVIRDGPSMSVTGSNQIRMYAQALAARNYHAERGAVTIEGNRLRWNAKVSFDGLRALGVERVDAAAEAVIEKGKVKLYQPGFSPGAMSMMATAGAVDAERFVRAFVAEVFNAGTLDKAEEYVAPEYVDHAPFPGRPPTLQGLKDGLADLRVAMPDLRVDVEEVVATGDRAVIRSTWTGTHKGPYQGAQPTQRQARVGAIEILRLKDGRIVESWRQLDSGELAKQLGLFDQAMGKPAAAAPAGGTERPGGRRNTKKGTTTGLLGWLNDL